MRTHPKAWTYGIASITLLVALVLFLGPQQRDISVAAPKPAVTPAAEAPAIEPMRIAPADVLGTGTPWAPLTGDGSN